MKRMNTALAALCLFVAPAFATDDYSDHLAKVANDTIVGWASDPVVLDTLRTQNMSHGTLTEDEIIALDVTWREQVVSGGNLVDGILSNPLSVHLKQIKSQAGGRFTEIFISDIRGLNAGQSDLTSDYWQGDEDKWQVPHATSDIHIGEVEFDESTQTYQSQISVPIMDQGSFIGVITVGVDLEQLAAAY